MLNVLGCFVVVDDVAVVGVLHVPFSVLFTDFKKNKICVLYLQVFNRNT